MCRGTGGWITGPWWSGCFWKSCNNRRQEDADHPLSSGSARGGSSHMTATIAISASEAAGRYHAAGMAAAYRKTDSHCLRQLACGDVELVERTWVQSAA